MGSRRIAFGLFLLAGGMLAPSRGVSAPVAPVTLWQEDYYWDGLMSERTHGRMARESADPNLNPVLKTIAQQVADQVVNLRQVGNYTKIQQENLEFASKESDPTVSLATIQSNLDTLSKGTAQIRSNFFFLATRCRMAATQALPEPELTKISAVLIRQIQMAQLELNALYGNAAVLQSEINSRTRPKENFLRYQMDSMVVTITQTQSSIFAIYNASYEIYVRSKE